MEESLPGLSKVEDVDTICTSLVEVWLHMGLQSFIH